MLQIYKQNKKLFLSLLENSFTEKPSPLEIKEEDKYLEKETLEKLKREEIDEMVERDINNFIASLDIPWDTDTLVDKDINEKRKEQLEILINYINASNTIQEKFTHDYTKIDIQKLWVAFQIVKNTKQEVQEVKGDVSAKNGSILKSIFDAKNTKDPQQKIFKENMILVQLWYLKLEGDNLNVKKEKREEAIKSLQRSWWLKETGTFDSQFYQFLEKIHNPSWRAVESVSPSHSQQSPEQEKTTTEKSKEEKDKDKEQFIIEFNSKKATKQDVIKLQQTLNIYLWLDVKKKINEKWVFWPYTKKILKKVKNNISSGISISKNGLPIVGESTFEQTSTQVDKTKESVNYLKQLLEKTDELNKRLEKYIYENKEGYSIGKFFEWILSKDALDKMLNKEQEKKYENLLNKGENKERLERAVMFLSSDYVESEESWNTKKLNWKWSGVLETIKKVLPWLGWIYLMDIPLPLTKTLIPWADIGKSVAFENWINNGMQGEFKDYYKQNKKEVDVVQNQNILIKMLTELKLTDEQKAKVLSGKLGELDRETQELIKTYIAKRLIPDLRILQRKSYDAFERKTWYTFGGLFWIFWDKKYSEWQKIIKLMEEWLKNGTTDIELADRVLELLIEENSKKVQWVLTGTKERQAYFKTVKEKAKIIEYNHWLTSLWGEYQKFSILFYVKNIYEIAEFGLSEEDKKFFTDFFDKILKKDEVGLKDMYAKNKVKIDTIIEQLFKGGSKVYLLSQIPKNKKWLDYVKVWKAQHWPNIKWLSGEEVYEKLSTTTTEKNGQTPSLGNVYATFVENGFISLSYSEFWKSIRLWKQVDINEVKQKINNSPLVNTARNKGNGTLTTLESLSEKWDKEVFALDPIEKTYTYYKDGKEVTARVTYNLYLRSDCSNPLVIPWDVKITEKESDIKFNSSTYALVNGRLPIVIPWFVLFSKKPPLPEEKNSSIETTPWSWEAWDIISVPWQTWQVSSGLSWQAPNIWQEIPYELSWF